MILIDNRIGSAEFKNIVSVPSVLCHLDYADFAWSGNGPDGTVNVGAERKSLLDFLSSMTSGRLSGHQLIGLVRDYDFVYVIVEGVWKADRKSGVLMRPAKGKWEEVKQGKRKFMAREIYNFMNSLSVICRVLPVYTQGKEETARWMESCYSWWQKKWESHKSHRQFNKVVDHAFLQKPNLVTRMAAQIDGIGWDKAQKLGEAFSCMGDLALANVEDIMLVDGIGEMLAQRIRDSLR